MPSFIDDQVHHRRRRHQRAAAAGARRRRRWCSLVLWLFIQRTRLGSAILAVSQDPEAAQYMGIPTDRIFSIVMAHLGRHWRRWRACWSRRFSRCSRRMGLLPMVKAFAIVIVGGLGSIPGSILARADARLFRDHRRLSDLDLMDRAGIVSVAVVLDAGDPARRASSAGGRRSDVGAFRAIDSRAALRCRRACWRRCRWSFGSNYLIGVLTVSADLRHLGGELGLHVRPDRPREFRPLPVHRRRRLHRGLPQHGLGSSTRGGACRRPSSSPSLFA